MSERSPFGSVEEEYRQLLKVLSWLLRSAERDELKLTIVRELVDERVSWQPEEFRAVVERVTKKAP